jgi:cholesterol oxidase
LFDSLQQVCLLERGKELQPGQYPNTLQEILVEMRLTLPDGSIYGLENGFIEYFSFLTIQIKLSMININISYNFFCSWVLSNNVIIWKGCGLGGGSLVNSNVSIKPGNQYQQ